jgi:hypothetical protein
VHRRQAAIRLSNLATKRTCRGLVHAWAALTRLISELVLVQARAIAAYERRALRQTFDLLAAHVAVCKSSDIAQGLRQSAQARLRLTVLRRAWDVWMGVCVRMAYALRVGYMVMCKRQRRIKTTVLAAWLLVNRWVSLLVEHRSTRLSVCCTLIYI